LFTCFSFQYDTALNGFALRFILPSLVLFPSWSLTLVLEAVLRSLRRMPGVLLVEEDAVVETHELQSQSLDASLWNLDRVDQRPKNGDGYVVLIPPPEHHFPAQPCL
jgi:hypothetical protein